MRCRRAVLEKAHISEIGLDDIEDLALPPIDGVRQSVALLRRVITSAAWGLGQ